MANDDEIIDKDAPTEGPQRQARRQEPVRKTLLIILGVLCVILATVGIFLPLLPTTPFLLLAAAAFTRSSDRLYTWLINHRWFGTYIRNYREHRAITLQTKILAIALLWSTIGYSVLAVLNNWIWRGVVIAIAVGTTIHLLRLKTLTQEMIREQREQRSSAPKDQPAT
jgi:hypothetical protein